MTIKKYIEIPEEILVGLAEGNFVKGSLHRDKNTGRIVFNAYYLKPCKPRIICAMDREMKVATAHLVDREIVDRV